MHKCANLSRLTNSAFKLLNIFTISKCQTTGEAELCLFVMKSFERIYTYNYIDFFFFNSEPLGEEGKRSNAISWEKSLHKVHKLFFLKKVGPI